MDPTSPVGRLYAKTMELNKPIISIIAESNPTEFDRKFGDIEPKLQEWKTLFQAVGPTGDTNQLNAASNIASLMVRLLTSVKETSERIGATKGKNPSDYAASAGGKRRKMTRKYCKKTPCKKMGFSQKASCRPYKNCFTRRRVRRRV